MAWQHAANMGGNGGSPAGGTSDAGNPAGQTQGTEYTLQGVMRFLQTEWHRHERDRNAWQIERAEMKSRIAKLEGDLRTNKKLRESMDKHIRMLESALRRRNQEKVQTAQASDQAQTSETHDNIKSEPIIQPPPPKPHNSFLDLDHEEGASPCLKHEEERDRSRTYLSKCIEEFAYHVFTSTSIQPNYTDEQESMLQNHQYSNHHPQQQHSSLEDVYVQSQQKQQQRNSGALGPSPIPNHQPPVGPGPQQGRGLQPQEQNALPARRYQDLAEEKERHPLRPVTAIDRSNQSRSDFNDEQRDRVTPSYEPYQTENQLSADQAAADTDGWNFDDTSEVPPAENAFVQEYAVVPQRPDTDVFPIANHTAVKSPTRSGLGSHRRKSSLSRRRQGDGSHELRELSTSFPGHSSDTGQFKVRYALRGHLDVVRSVIFTGGGSPSAPEICTAGDDGVVKRWIAASSPQKGDDLDLRCEQTHRGHTGAVLCLAASPTYQPFTNGGRAQGDGWVFSGGEDTTVRIWERGRVDPKATLDGHTDAVWAVCVLPGNSGSILGDSSMHHGGPDRTILVSGGADGVILIWSVSTPPQVSSPHTGSRRGPGGSRRANSVSSGSNFPSSPQPSTATSRPCHYSLVHRIECAGRPSPTSISPLSMSGETFVVSFTDASVLVFNTHSGEEMVGMASLVTYDGTPATGVNTVAATTSGSGHGFDQGHDENAMHGATGSSSGVEGMVFSGHEDQYIRFFDANSGQCTYDMLAHPAAISSLSLSPSGTELVSAGHDASLRFWSLEKRTCTQEITSHRLMRGEGVCCVVWSQDGRWVVSGGGDGVVKVFARLPSSDGGSGGGGGGAGAGG